MKRKTVLVIEDDAFVRELICEKLHDREIDTIEAGSETEALQLVQSNAAEIDVALIDIRVPSKVSSDGSDSSRGQRTGLRIARTIRQEHPHMRLIGMSFFAGEEIRDWFAEYGYAFLPKSWLSKGAGSDFVDIVEQAVRKRHRKRKPKTFIVHGHDKKTLSELVNFVQRNLRWGRPKVLRELPSNGRTIIEKFEDASDNTDIVFVLLTPDDKAVSVTASDEAKRRARQNVIFELGYFYAKLQRIGGRVILLHRGKIELPSDISGITYVDISKGIEPAGDAIRRELIQWLRE